MTKERYNKLYFDYLVKLVTRRGETKYYNNLLELLHSREFTWIIPRDEDRASDGMYMREEFACANNYILEEVQDALEGPCSVLEMMVGLAYRCEHQIMGEAGNENPSKWFWDMIDNMALTGMDDGRFDMVYAEQCIDVLLNREYGRNGEGGLFRVENSYKDVREMAIWSQMCWYLDGFI